MAKQDPMSELCKMVVETEYRDLPGDVVGFAKKCILDAVAVMIGGSAMEGIQVLADFVKERGGNPESVIPFYGGKAPAAEVGLVMGSMARAMDFGPVHVEAGHNSEYIVPLLLAAAGLKKRVSGREFITAFVVGMEVGIRIGIAWKFLSEGIPHGKYGGHWIFGAVAAAAKLLGLDVEAAENAQGIARGKTQPHDLAMFSPATLMVRVHHGFIAHDAIDACLLAKRGITGPRHEVLTGPKGYLAMSNWKTNPKALLRGLGAKWEMMNIMMKPYCACKATHAAIFGVLDQMEKYNFKACDVRRIDIDVSSPNWAIVCTPRKLKWDPHTVAECQFSLPYTVATAAFDKKVFLDSYTPQSMSRENVREFMTRIFARRDSNLPSWMTRVKTTLKDGKRHSKEYFNVKGHPKNPFTDEELLDRFRMCVPYSYYKLDDATVDSLINSIVDLEKNDDIVGSIMLPLTPK